jgi:tRNA A-37 threonylcarbamoyl transferase component Bud32
MQEPFNLAELAFEGVTITTEEAAALARPLELAWVNRYGWMSFNSKTRATVLARAVHAPGKPHVMVKCYSAARPRDAEVRCYQALESMQGKQIPILIEADYAMPHWFAKKVGKSFKFAMVLSFISDIYRIHSFLPTEYMEVCRKLVQRMHVLGVSHGNPIDENILYNKEKNEAVILDFRKGCTLARVGKKKFLEACNEDMDIMDSEIEMYERTWGSRCTLRRGLAEQ